MILIIGYGNSLRRDDGAGQALAKMVKDSCSERLVRVLDVLQLAPELAEEIATPEVTSVLFMDASVAEVGLKPECEEAVSITQLFPQATSRSFGHHFGPSTLLAYAAHVFGKCPDAWLVSIPGTDFGFGEGFSDKVSDLLPLARQQVLEFLQDLSPIMQ